MHFDCFWPFLLWSTLKSVLKSMHFHNAQQISVDRRPKHIIMYAFWTENVLVRMGPYILQGKYLQSSSKALPLLPITEINWSIIPHGMLAKLCSAFWQARALTFKSFCSFPVSCSKNVYVATSSDAELDNPPPRGTEVAGILVFIMNRYFFSPFQKILVNTVRFRIVFVRP